MKQNSQPTWVVLWTLLLLPLLGFAQSKLDVAKQYLNDPIARELGLKPEDWANPIVSSETFSANIGMTSLYLQQQVHDIPVFNAILNVHLTQDDRLITYASRFFPGASTLTNSPTPSLTAAEAVAAAARALNYNFNSQELVLLSNKGGANQVNYFVDKNLSFSDIKVSLVWQPTPDGRLSLAWEVWIEQPDGSNYWMARVDAQTGVLLDKNNLVVSCNFGPHEPGEQHQHNHAAAAEQAAVAPVAIGGGTYNVYGPPLESPLYGSRSLISDPATLASPFGWHDTNGAAGAEFTITRGNNVYAREDADANNTGGFSPDGGASLNFDFPIDFTQQPVNYRSAAITNLFFWNNYIHDHLYNYGFDEASGNFQTNNYGNGGTGNDPVNAEAQDGSGTNNANFSTPADGSSPRMQMYLWNTASPQLDGDLDNGIIAHEYGHGVSNRLTGGPATTSCLNNSEQMGEGWSDWIGLMLSIQPGDAGTDSRGIGNYALNQSTSGNGIRPTPYSTNMAINPVTYNTIKTSAVPHGVGYVWCGMIWDLTWALIDAHGMSTGYDEAMNLVMTGMKLQPCSPGFVDGRNAILAADQALYGGANKCLIWGVFARRGLGFSATQGSTSSVSDGVQAFDRAPACFIDIQPASATLCSGQNTSFTLTLGASASGSYTLSAANVPAGYTGAFTNNPIVGANASTTFTLTSTGATVPNNYTITITANNGVETLTNSIALLVQNGAPAAPTLNLPANTATNVSASPTFTWTGVVGATGYDFEIATDAGFGSIVESKPNLNTTSTTLTNPLMSNTTYYWRVRVKNNCGNGTYTTRSFTTICGTSVTIASTNVPVVISDTGTPTITSTLTVPNTGTVAKIVVKNLNVSHSYIGDLDIYLKSPNNTTVRLMNSPCNSEDNILINFDDDAASTVFPCPPIANGTFKPNQPLSGFNGVQANGTWTLEIRDLFNVDGGSLNAWTLELYINSTFYQDNDGDGYGNSSVTTSACEAPSGYVAVGGDCADNDATRFPGNPEVCDGKDNNCNGTIDEGLSTVTAITCPANVVTTNASNQCGANVTFANPTANGCGTVTYTSSPASGSLFNVGTTTVTFTGTTGSGTLTCSFTVTVNDTQLPTVTCPTNITVGNASNQCGANVTFVLSGTDNCTTPTLSSSPASGSFFNVGTTTVTATATDASNNTKTCSFTVRVNDTQAPIANCPANLLDNNATNQCGRNISYNISATDNCPGATTTVSPASGSFFSVGTTTVTATATDASNNTGTCSFTVTVNDTQKPTANCPANISVVNASGQCAANVTFTLPAATDNCPGVSASSNPASGSAFNGGTTTVTVTATDAHNNTGTCTFTVTVSDSQAPTANCPANTTVNSAANACTAAVSFVLSATDNCPGATVASTPASGSTFNLGTTTVTATATDASNNTGTCSFTVTVRDTEAPSITCPPAVQRGSLGFECGTDNVNLGSPNATDNCGLAGVGNDAPGFYPVGSTTVIWTATDLSNNTATCAQQVTVVDNVLPTVVCPGNTTVTSNTFDCSAEVFFDILAADNCGVAYVDYSHDSGETFSGGSTLVEVTAFDDAGNQSGCAFWVFVQAGEEVCDGTDNDCDGLVDEADNFNQQSKQVEGLSAAFGQFGNAVAIHQNTAVVGIQSDDTQGNNAGAARIFDRNANGQWVAGKRLVATDAAADDQLGHAVALVGDFALVAANLRDDNGINAGAVYVFGRNQGGLNKWGQVGKLLANDGTSNQNFGASVAFDGRFAIVGANLDDQQASNAGAAYIFDSQNAWAQVAKIVAADGQADDQLGGAVSVDQQEFALLGAAQHDASGDNAGAAYLYRRNATDGSWNLVKKLTASNGAAGDRFGQSVDLQGVSAVVGAPKSDYRKPNGGVAYVFDRNKNGLNNWGESAKLFAYDSEAGEQLGTTVAVDGALAVVGAPYENAKGSGAGAAYTYFRQDNGVWIFLEKIVDPTGNLDDNAFAALALSDRTILAGAPRDDDNGFADRGTAQWYEAICDNGNSNLSTPNILPGSTIGTPVTATPADLRAQPLPFTDVLTVSFGLAADTDARVTVVNTLGQVVAILHNGSLAEGTQVLAWRPEASLPDGVYWVRLDAGTRHENKQVMRVRR